MVESVRTVMVVDDEPTIQRYLSEVLTQQGYECRCFEESLMALAYLSHAKVTPDLLMTDVRMPGMNGIELLRRVRALAPNMPVILVSGYYEPEVAIEAVRAGADEYLFKPVRPEELLAVVDKHLQAARAPQHNPVHNALADFLSDYLPQAEHFPFSENQLVALEALFQALGFRRYETMQHSLRVAAYAVRLGRRCGLSSPELRDVECGALMHDIGKIAIPHNVLLKPGPLTAKEWEVMRMHPLIGYHLLGGLPRIRQAAEIVYSHHERHDGTGYPRRLQGEQIPIGARLFSIVDAFDAITSDRAYRPAQDYAAALREIQKGSGSQFDPRLADVFAAIPEAELAAIRQQYPDAEVMAPVPVIGPVSPAAGWRH